MDAIRRDRLRRQGWGFKDLVQETLRTIREMDSQTCIFSAFPDEANRAAVEVYGDPTSETRDALRGVGSPATYYPSLSAL